MFGRFWVMCAILIGLTGCNPIANLDEAEKQIKRFERVYSEGDVDQLWGLTSETWKEASPRADFDNLNRVLDVRLGKIKSSDRVNFNVNSVNGLTTTVVVMDTSFEKGVGTQTYTFHGNSDDLELVGWTVNSPRLQLTADDVADEDERSVERMNSEPS